jgi:hypothetical protein
MIRRNRLNDPTALIRIGMGALLLASLLKYFAVDHPIAGLGADVRDGAMGMMYGISIAATLLGLRRKSRGQSGAECGMSVNQQAR